MNILDSALYKDGFLEFGIRQRRRPVDIFTVAIFDSEIDLAPQLKSTIGWAEVVCHSFSTSEELFRLGQKYMLDLILIPCTGVLKEELDILVRAKQTTALATIPTVVYHPQPDKSTYIRALRAGADDVFGGYWDNDVCGVKINMLSQRSIRDLGVNPTSRLPGPSLIERDVDKRIEVGEEFAVCYLDIDNFKAYNDYYGYVYGDKVIRLTAHIVRDIVYDLVPDGFVGHVGGDDFLFIIPYPKVDIVCSNIIKTFDRIIPYKYKADDRERGKIVSKNRRGEDEVFPLLTISIAVVVNHDQMFTHIGEMSHMLADLKKYTKKLAGSNYMVERRKKY